MVKRYLVKIALLTFCVGQIVVPPQVGNIQERPRGTSVTAVIKSENYRLLEPIEVEVVITNSTIAPIYTDVQSTSAYNNVILKLQYVHPTSQAKVPKANYITFLHNLPGHGSRTIEPGGAIHYVLIVNLAFDLTLPHDYALTVSVPYWTEQIRTPAGRQIAKSDPITFGVEGFPSSRKLK